MVLPGLTKVAKYDPTSDNSNLQTFPADGFWERQFAPGTLNNQFFNGCLMKQPFFHVMICFVSQLKQPF